MIYRYKMSSMSLQFQSILQQAIQAFRDANFDEADLILRGVLRCDIKSADTIFALGVAYAKSNRLKEALIIFECLLSFQNGHARALYNVGLIHSLQGMHQLALEAYDLALESNPDDVEVLINKGSTCNEVENYILALESLENAIRLRPDIPEAWVNKGIALNNLNLYQESIDAYNQAIKIHPSYHEAWSNKSAPLNKLKRFAEATEACDKALSLKPKYVEAWVNKGVTFYELKNYDEAIAHYDKGLTLKPDYALTWFNKGMAMHQLKRYDEAIAHYEKALSLKPNIDWVFGDLLHAKMQICSWSDFDCYLKDISNKVLSNEKVTNPFPLLAMIDDPALHKKSSEIYIKNKYPFNAVLGPIAKHSKKEKIRIGYFSADFYNHATGHLIAELFELHDKHKFELIGFSFGPVANDEMRQRLQNSFDQFIEVGDKSDMEIAQLSRSLNIDIGVDLKGFTQDSRLGIFANRVAPIQINYLGYPGTTGADYIDYIIADQILIPPHLQEYYSEKIVFLPDSYQVNDRKRVISDKKLARQELGLPENGFVFCCFNNNYKFTPSTFDTWMRILNAVNESVLWIFQDNPWVVDNLRNEADKHGVDVKRLIFAERMPLAMHLARHSLADLFLDTFPYNAHTTASDALWAGLPVLTLMGQSFASRVAASLLNAIGLPELVTNTAEEYEALAIDLALNPKKLGDAKLKLASNRLTSPLFNTPLFTKNIESAYIKMYERYHSDLQPDHVRVLEL